MVARVEGEVLGHPGGAVVVEAELVAEVADRAGVPPPLDRNRVLLDQPEGGERSARREQEPGDPPALGPAQAERAADEIGGDWGQVVAQAVQHRLRSGVPPEGPLGQEGV